MNGNPRDQAKVSVHCRWPLIRETDGHVEWSRTLITCQYTAGGRSRRGSPKAGTTVELPVNYVNQPTVTLSVRYATKTVLVKLVVVI